LRSKIIICFIVLFSTQDLYSSDTISKRVDRNFYKFLAVEGAVLTGAISYLKNEWYSDKTTAWKKFDENLQDRANQLGFSVHEVVTLASIIEGEAMLDSERSTISSVYHNRLKINMKLQADPTIQYIIPGPPKTLSNRDLRIKSDYNTYQNYGLPPGPINNPGIASIKAALYPEDTNFLFFVAQGDGSHAFTTNEKDHEEAKRIYKINKRKNR